MFVLNEANGTWKRIEQVKLPASWHPKNEVIAPDFSMSCPTATYCGVIGLNAAGYSYMLNETNGIWGTVGRAPNVLLLSCFAAQSCVAVGTDTFFDDRDGVWSASATVVVQDPPWRYPLIYDFACKARSSCSAVGSDTNEDVEFQPTDGFVFDKSAGVWGKPRQVFYP